MGSVRLVEEMVLHQILINVRARTHHLVLVFMVAQGPASNVLMEIVRMCRTGVLVGSVVLAAVSLGFAWVLAHRLVVPVRYWQQTVVLVGPGVAVIVGPGIQ